MEVTNLEKKGNTVFEPTKLIMATQLSRFTQNSKKSHFEECFYFLKNPFSNCNYALCEKRGKSHAWKSLVVSIKNPGLWAGNERNEANEDSFEAIEESKKLQRY